jgi:glycine hydroxymethyltransferase
MADPGLEAIARRDPAVHAAIAAEERRQRTTLELIASENFPSPAVLAAMATPLNNKYAEGYPGRRYYGGCEFVDVVETLARDRARQLFAADHANVQPHSGAANSRSSWLCCPGRDPARMALPHGGHLSHGSPANHSGIIWKPVHYGVNPATGIIDYDKVRDLALQHRPGLVIAGGSNYARVIDFAAFRSIADEVGAPLLVDMAHFAGLVAGGVYPSPVPHAQVVTSTTHKTLRGPRGGLILCIESLAKAVDKSVFPGHQGGPLEHVIAAKAVAFHEALTDDFKVYAAQTVANARALAAGLMARGHAIVSGGTDSHLMTLDLRTKGMTGKEAEAILGRAGITVNKNTVPDDPHSPFVTSGVRLGTPAVTTRGMGEAEMDQVADLIVQALARPDDDALARVRAKAVALADAFPLYADEPAEAGR